MRFLILAVVAGLSFLSIQARSEELILKLAPGSEVHSLHQAIDARFRSPFRLFTQFEIVTLPDDVGLVDAIKYYESSPFVEYAEPNYQYSALGRPSDPLYKDQWALEQISASRAWEIAQGNRSIVVAVIDTGVDYTHPDLQSNMWNNPGESGSKEKDGIDNDGNGFIDDVYGWNFYDKTNDPKDDHTHGTHCAGIIGAAHDGQGSAGVAPNVSIMALKFLSGAGTGTTEDAILATEYAIQNGAQILSNSWGGEGYSKAFHEVIEETNRRGMIYVAAAGNDHSNNDTQPMYPASYPVENVIAVASSDPRDQISFFSNWGQKTVHVAAPGSSILSTVLNGKHHAYSGTSMACPHVAGAAALLKAHTQLSNLEIKSRIVQTVDPQFQMEKLMVAGGRLNLYNALTNTLPPPPPPEEGWTEAAYRLESPHPYPPLANHEWTFRHPGAKFIKLHFAKVDTERRVDYIAIKDETGKVIETLNGNQGALWSRPIPGDTVKIQLRSDSVNELFGFEIDQYKYRLE